MKPPKPTGFGFFFTKIWVFIENHQRLWFQFSTVSGKLQFLILKPNQH